MEEELKRAAQTGDIDAFYGVVEREPAFLKIIENEDFAETPLHVAAGHGQSEFAIEILSLKPSFGKKLNPSGFSPLDLALSNGHRETVKQLVKFVPELIGVRSRERKTPLHYVAETDDADLLAEFLVACPTAIKELTIRGETAVHLAVLAESRRAFQVLMDWISRTDSKNMLLWKDNKGNTALHIAARTSQLEVIKRLIKEKVDLDEINHEKQAARDIVRTLIEESVQNPTIHDEDNVKIQKMLDSAGSRWEVLMHYRMLARMGWEEGITGDTRNAYLVVTVLLVTATFQAVLSPPISQHDNNNNKNNHKNNILFYFIKNKGILLYPFMVLNSVTFVTSVALTFMLLPTKSYNLLAASLISLSLCYYLCLIINVPPYSQQFTNLALLAGACTSLAAIIYAPSIKI